MNSAHRQLERLQHSESFTPRTLTPAEIEARRVRPSGSADERAKRVRQILSASTFTVAPRPVGRPWQGV